MPDRPLILFPSPERADCERKAPSFPRIMKPSFSRQFARLQPSFNVLQAAFEQKNLKIQQSPTGINPEFALVFEIIGTVDNFYTAVKNTDGLEWMKQTLFYQMMIFTRFREMAKEMKVF